MPLNTSSAELQRRAAEELALKLRLEKKVQRRFSTLFRIIARDFRAVYAETGVIPDATEYLEESIAILRPLYREASQAVGTTIRENIKAIDPNTFETKQEAEVSRRVREFATQTPAERSAFIMNTTQKDMSASVNEVITAAALEGEELAQEEVARLASREFVEKSRPRPEVIAMTETLNAVEGSKFVELTVLLSLGATVSGVPLEDVTLREWVAVLDTKTRPTHVVADGQRRDTDHPFEVGRSLLRFPGDTSLGADLAEIIHCRCGAFTVISDFEVEAEAVDVRLTGGGLELTE